MGALAMHERAGVPVRVRAIIDAACNAACMKRATVHATRRQSGGANATSVQTFDDDEEKPLARAAGDPEHNPNGQGYMVDFHSTTVRQHGAAPVGSQAQRRPLVQSSPVQSSALTAAGLRVVHRTLRTNCMRRRAALHWLLRNARCIASHACRPHRGARSTSRRRSSSSASSRCDPRNARARARPCGCTGNAAVS